MKSTRIHNKKILYNPKDKKGIEYLRDDLQDSEARVFFNQARSQGEADFEDEYERQFRIIRNNDGTYSLVRRK